MQIHTPLLIDGLSQDIRYALMGLPEEDFMTWAEAPKPPPTSSPEEVGEEVSSQPAQTQSAASGMLKHLLLLNLIGICLGSYYCGKVFLQDRSRTEIAFDQMIQKIENSDLEDQIKSQTIGLTKATELADRSANRWREATYQAYFCVALLCAGNLWYLVPPYLKHKKQTKDS